MDVSMNEWWIVWFLWNYKFSVFSLDCRWSVNGDLRKFHDSNWFGCCERDIERRIALVLRLFRVSHFAPPFSRSPVFFFFFFSSFIVAGKGSQRNWELEMSTLDSIDAIIFSLSRAFCSPFAVFVQIQVSFFTASDLFSFFFQMLDFGYSFFLIWFLPKFLDSLRHFPELRIQDMSCIVYISGTI